MDEFICKRAVYEDDVIKLLNRGWKSGVYPLARDVRALPSAQPERPKGYMKIEANIVDGEDVICETCGAYCLSPSYKFCPKCGIEFKGVQNEQDE